MRIKLTNPFFAGWGRELAFFPDGSGLGRLACHKGPGPKRLPPRPVPYSRVRLGTRLAYCRSARQRPYCSGTHTVGTPTGYPLGLGMPRIMAFGPLRKQPFASPLTPPSQRRASAFRPHAGTKAVLPFTGSFGRLESAFHDGTELERLR